MKRDVQVGYLNKNKAYCLNSTCRPEDDQFGPEPVRLYHSNIYPYSQHCATCGIEMVMAQGPAWPELFDP